MARSVATVVVRATGNGLGRGGAVVYWRDGESLDDAVARGVRRVYGAGTYASGLDPHPRDTTDLDGLVRGRDGRVVGGVHVDVRPRDA